MISGSQESLDLLESIIECSNDEIFITKYIRQVLTDKWQKVKWLMCIQGIIYALYLIFLSLYLIEISREVFFGSFIINLLLIAYEFLQMIIMKLNYFKDI